MDGKTKHGSSLVYPWLYVFQCLTKNLDSRHLVVWHHIFFLLGCPHLTQAQVYRLIKSNHSLKR